jgi:hypothetical protein
MNPGRVFLQCFDGNNWQTVRVLSNPPPRKFHASCRQQRGVPGWQDGGFVRSMMTGGCWIRCDQPA